MGVTLPTHEFIRRFLIHVLPKGLHRIRHYGLFANRKNRAANIAGARQLFAVPQSTAQHNIDPAAKSDQPRALSKPCPCCGGRVDHHRDLRARLSAQARSGIDQDQLLMTPSPLIDDRTRTNRSLRRSTDNARARAKPLSLSGAPPARQSPYSPAEQLPQPLQSKLIKPAAATKSP